MAYNAKYVITSYRDRDKAKRPTVEAKQKIVQNSLAMPYVGVHCICIGLHRKPTFAIQCLQLTSSSLPQFVLDTSTEFTFAFLKQKFLHLAQTHL